MGCITKELLSLQQDFKKVPKKAAFGWVGGKSKLANTIIAQFPNHVGYCEVFGGALNILYRKERSKIEIVNDINSDLINLHKVIQKNPQTLSLYLNEMFISRDIFNDIRHKRLLPRNKIQEAAFYYYKTVLSFGSKGTSFAMPKYNRAPKNIYRSFKLWSDRLKGVVIENMEFEKLIVNYDYEDMLFYLDPPYIGTESYYDMPSGFNITKHELLAKLLKNIKGKFVLSYNDCEVVRKLYKGFNIKEVGTSYCLNNKHRNNYAKELIINNF